MLKTATTCLENDLCILPAKGEIKRPTVAWKEYQTRLPTEHELSAWMANGPDSICIVTGTISGNLEMIDFDMGGECYEAWGKKVPQDLLKRLIVERTPSGGYHVVYRCDEPISGNLKLAQRNGAVLIETRGKGGLFLCAPSPRYVLLQGDLSEPPVLTFAERESLLMAAWSFNEQKIPESHAPSSTWEGGVRPGDDFNARGDVRGLLLDAGWALEQPGENERWRRPGKSKGHSATLKDRVFYVFSSNAGPFEPHKPYSPFSLYATLHHACDFSAASVALRELGYGEEIDDIQGVDISGIMSMISDPATGDPKPDDPGHLPLDLLRIPGFVSEVIDYSLETAPYPNTVMAFCGALALQAFLAGRKVRDPGDNRTNLYILGLAHSASGKDWPRKVNTRIAFGAGLLNSVGDKFASGEGLQDALLQNPSMLFQTDEIDGMLLSMTRAKDARHESIMGALLSLYSSSNSVFPMRAKAGTDVAGVIDQPCLVMLGNAIPTHYYEALSERMLTNGFFARMLILESGKRASGQEAQIREIPGRVADTAGWWADFNPGGNLVSQHPVPRIVDQSERARKALATIRDEADSEYMDAEKAGGIVGMTVWGRVNEQIRKLSLIYAISENHEAPEISLRGVQWAAKLVMHQTRRMIFMAGSHVADNPFHAECLKVSQILEQAGGSMTHSKLLKRMRTDAKSFGLVVKTMIDQGDIVAVKSKTKGRTGLEYVLKK